MADFRDNREKPDFQTIKAEEIKFGNNNFIEVARKKAVTQQGENEFVAISRGFFAPDGSKRFKRSFTIPDNQEVVDFVCSKVKEMAALKGAGKGQAVELEDVE